MAKKTSAGLLMFRTSNDQVEVFLVHPGGPYFRNKDDGAWTIPKGEVESEELVFDTALREFQEETGIRPAGDFIPLDKVKQKGGKVVHAWAFEGNWDESSSIESNYFEMEWPPRSGKKQQFAEIDKAQFFSVPEAKHKINPAQIEFVDRLEAHLADSDK
jgi:predicted NUDIX family NTP pyrophosphohydrolase